MLGCAPTMVISITENQGSISEKEPEKRLPQPMYAAWRVKMRMPSWPLLVNRAGAAEWNGCRVTAPDARRSCDSKTSRWQLPVKGLMVALKQKLCKWFERNFFPHFYIPIIVQAVYSKVVVPDRQNRIGKFVLLICIIKFRIILQKRQSRGYRKCTRATIFNSFGTE